MQHLSTELRKRQRGFSILEMLLATIILLVGLVAIAQLVPASMLLNYRNRTDSAALVFAQRELDQMIDQQDQILNIDERKALIVKAGRQLAGP